MTLGLWLALVFTWFNSLESRLDAVYLLILPSPVWSCWHFGVLLGAVYVNFDAWFEPLLARGVYRDSIESSGLGFGLVNQPECDLGYICFFIVYMVLVLVWLFITDIGIEKC